MAESLEQRVADLETNVARLIAVNHALKMLAVSTFLAQPSSAKVIGYWDSLGSMFPDAMLAEPVPDSLIDVLHGESEKLKALLARLGEVVEQQKRPGKS